MTTKILFELLEKYRTAFNIIWNIAFISGFLFNTHNAKGSSLMPGKIGVDLQLPPVIYAIPGIECNIYFENICLVVNPQNYIFYAKCSKGIQFDECWRYTPKSDEVGTYPLHIEVRDQENTLLEQGDCQVVVVDPNAGKDSSIRMLMIGDSITMASLYTKHVLDLCGQETGPHLTLIGSNWLGSTPTTNRHEGYSGWQAYHFTSYYTGTARSGPYEKRGSPFLYVDEEGKPPVFDFGHYCRDVAEGSAPDIVTIFLGANDICWTTDETMKKDTNAYLLNLGKMIDRIHAYNNNILIGLIPPMLASHSQDGWGYAAGAKHTRWEFNRARAFATRKLYEQYGSGKIKNVEIIPALINLDTIHNFPTREERANAHSDMVIKRQADNAHPLVGGHQQIGDSIYCWLKFHMTKK